MPAVRVLGLPNEETIDQLARLLPQLRRPIIVFDIESTGALAETDRIFELAALKLSPVDRRLEASVLTIRCNPGVPMAPEVARVHGVRDEDLAHLSPFSSFAQEVMDFFTGCDLAGYNIAKFDVRMLAAELGRCGLSGFPQAGVRMLDSYPIFAKHLPRNLEGAARYYLGDEKAASFALEAHGAAADVLISLEVFAAQLEREDVPKDLDKLADFGRRVDWVDREGKFIWRAGEAVVAVTKHKGRTLRDLATNDRGFLSWILGKDFPEDTKEIARNALAGIFPAPPQDPSDA